MALALVTAPTVEPITLAEARLHLKIDSDQTDDDALVSSLIAAARGYAEVFTRRQLVTATYDYKLENFSCPLRRRGSWEQFDAAEILLPQPPAQSITSITYTTPDGTQTTLSAAAYELDTTAHPARLRPAFGYSWPSVRQQYAAVVIRFVAGYGLAAAVPDGIKAAIKLMLAHWYEHREAVTEISAAKMPLAAQSLLLQHRYGQHL